MTNHSIIFTFFIILCVNVTRSLNIGSSSIPIFKFSAEPKCLNCKNYMPNKNSPSLGLCTMFGNKNDKIRYSFAKHCRENEDQCGKQGYLYEEPVNEKIPDLERLKFEFPEIYEYSQFLQRKE